MPRPPTLFGWLASTLAVGVIACGVGYAIVGWDAWILGTVLIAAAVLVRVVMLAGHRRAVRRFEGARFEEEMRRYR